MSLTLYLLFYSFLESLSFSQDRVEIRGTAPSQAHIDRYLDALKQSGSFVQLTLEGTERGTDLMLVAISASLTDKPATSL